MQFCFALIILFADNNCMVNCNSNPCIHNETCTDGVKSFTRNCEDDSTGNSCGLHFLTLLVMRGKLQNIMEYVGERLFMTIVLL